MNTSDRWRIPWGAVIITLLILAGVTAMTYPTMANWFYQYRQAQLIQGYGQTVAHASPPPTRQLDQAHEYNNALRFGAEVEANHRLPTGSGTVAQGVVPYRQQLNVGDSGIMARLRIRRIDLDLPIYHGTDDDTLLKGVGHLEGTSLPVGGAATHSVLTAHRGLADAALFTELDKVAVGDTFSIEVLGEILTYRVEKTRVVQPSETEALRVQADRDLITLITCTPLGINSHRILVTGSRIPTPKDAPKPGVKPEVPRFPWWAIWLSASYMLGAAYIMREGYPRPEKPRRALES